MPIPHFKETPRNLATVKKSGTISLSLSLAEIINAFDLFSKCTANVTCSKKRFYYCIIFLTFLLLLRLILLGTIRHTKEATTKTKGISTARAYLEASTTATTLRKHNWTGLIFLLDFFSHLWKNKTFFSTANFSGSQLPKPSGQA